MAKRLPIDVSDLELTSKELKFLGEYVTQGYNDVAAYKKFYNTKGMANSDIKMEALALVNDRRIKLGVQRFVNLTLDPYRDMLEHQVLNILQRRAFYDPSDFYNDDGSVKPLDQIEHDLRKCIDDVKEDWKGKDADRRQVTYTLAKRMEALKMLQALLKEGQAVKEEGSEKEKAGMRDTVKGILGQLPNILKAARGEDIKEKAQPIALERDKSPVIDIKVEPEIPEGVPSLIEKKALDITNKANAGFPLDDPLVAKARQIARNSK